MQFLNHSTRRIYLDYLSCCSLYCSYDLLRFIGLCCRLGRRLLVISWSSSACLRIYKKGRLDYSYAPVVITYIPIAIDIDDLIAVTIKSNNSITIITDWLWLNSKMRISLCSNLLQMHHRRRLILGPSMFVLNDVVVSLNKRAFGPLSSQRTIINSMICWNQLFSFNSSFLFPRAPLACNNWHEQSRISISSQVITCTSQHNESNSEETISIHSHWSTYPLLLYLHQHCGGGSCDCHNQSH